MREEDFNELRLLEEELWRDETRFDLQRMREIIAVDFIEFGRSGRVYSRDEVLTIKLQSIGAVLPLPSFQVRFLSADVAHVTYNSQITDNGIVQHARRSSIWTRNEAGWQLRFHQGTPFNDCG